MVYPVGPRGNWNPVLQGCSDEDPERPDKTWTELAHMLTVFVAAEYKDNGADGRQNCNVDKRILKEWSRFLLEFSFHVIQDYEVAPYTVQANCITNAARMAFTLS